MKQSPLCTGVALLAMLVVGVATSTAAPGAALTPMQELGRSLFFDKISSPASMACAECHGPIAGFTGPIPGTNLHGAVYPGAVPTRFGNRKPPSAAYATLSPIFGFDSGEGLFVGGNFWDGRATGEVLGNPAADQALGPFLNPVEQNNPSKAAVLEQVAASRYVDLWEQVWGEPLAYDTQAAVDLNYDRIGLAIAAYEDSPEVNQFSSKFDLFWANAAAATMDVGAIDMTNWMTYEGLGLTTQEVRGLALFNDESKGKCALCHVLDPYVDGSGAEFPPVFTDFTFDNLGTPRNPLNPFYDMDTVYLDDGTPINPLGAAWVDPGLGGFLASQGNAAWAAMAPENMGKHKVPTLRNVAKGPGPMFPKAYMHNGVFTTLADVVHFYNTRDVEPWPAPEVADNVNMSELGNLGLTAAEEADIVAFMRTLSDGYRAVGNAPGNLALAAPLAGRPVLSPNPFRVETTVEYALAASGHVRLAVYDVAGRRVATLRDGVEAAGLHTVSFQGATLPSGVYFLRLETPDAVRSIRATKRN